MIDTYRNVWRLLTPAERKRFVILCFATCIMALFEVATVGMIMPFLAVSARPDLLETQPVLQGFMTLFGLEGQREGMIGLSIAMLTMIATGTLVRAVVTFYQFRFSLMRAYSLASRLFHGYLSQDYIWHVSRHSSDTNTKILSEVDTVVTQSILPSILLMSNSIVIFMISALVFVLSPAVALTFLGLLTMVFTVIFWLLKQPMVEVGELRRQANRRRFRTVQEITRGLKEIKILGIERSSLMQFRLAAQEIAHLQTRGHLYGRLPRFAVEGAVYSGFVLVVLISVTRQGEDINNALPLLGAMGIAAIRLFPALQMAYQHIATLKVSYPALIKMVEQIETVKTRPLETPPDPLPMHKGVALRNVSFSYPESQTANLDNLTMEIPLHATIGVVGGTGAGKSTTIDILLGLLQPDEGTLEVDGKALTRQDKAAWQRNIGYVPQQIFLFNASIAENIAFGSDAEVDMAAVERAAKAAQLHEFIMTELPNGYDTKVGEAGVRLSGGQRQRVGIARALYRDPEVLILDEATSALDNATERAVMSAIDALAGSKTIIMIAHRLSTVENCDKIFFLENGRVAAEGTYEELLDNSASFRKIAVA